MRFSCSILSVSYRIRTLIWLENIANAPQWQRQTARVNQLLKQVMGFFVLYQ